MMISERRRVLGARLGFGIAGARSGVGGAIRRLASCHRNSINNFAWGYFRKWHGSTAGPTLILVLVIAGVVTACGVPPALTSGIIRGEQKYFSFDNVIGTQEPRDVPGIIEGLESRPGVFGIDTIEKIETKFISAGGICSRRGSIIECYIERSRISRDCFQSKCSLVQKEWTVRIRAPEKTGPIRPTVKIELRSSRSNLTSKNVETKNV
jgi:hypothetical protein